MSIKNNMWNIDELEPGALFMTDCWVIAHTWDEANGEIVFEWPEIPEGSTLLVIETDVEITWTSRKSKRLLNFEERLKYRSEPYTKFVEIENKENFISFLFGEQVVLLKRVALYSLTPASFYQKEKND